MDDRAAWLEERRGGLGGSDAASALGISKWKTPLDTYLDKRGEAPPLDDSPAMYWGRTLEPIVREEYAKRAGMIVHTGEGILRSAEHPFMLANLDGRGADGRVVEIKTARSADGWGDEGSADIPADYVAQTMHYMIVTGAQLADVAVLIAGSDFRIYTVPFDRELADMLIEAERELWQRIVDGNPPAPATASDIAKLYRIANGQPIEAQEPILRAWEALREARKAEKECAALVETLEAEIKGYMGACDTLTHAGRVIATWKQRAASARIDVKRLKAEAPEVFERFAVTGEPTRTFLLKEVKQ